MPGPDVEAPAEVRDDPAVGRPTPGSGRSDSWVGADRGTALDRAGRIAEVWLANAYVDERVLMDQLGRIKDTSVTSAACRDFVCDPSSKRAHSAARKMLADGYRGGRFDESVLIAGTPAECLEQMAGVAGLGFDDVLVRPQWTGHLPPSSFRCCSNTGTDSVASR